MADKKLRSDKAINPKSFRRTNSPQSPDDVKQAEIEEKLREAMKDLPKSNDDGESLKRQEPLISDEGNNQPNNPGVQNILGDCSKKEESEIVVHLDDKNSSKIPEEQTAEKITRTSANEDNEGTKKCIKCNQYRSCICKLGNPHFHMCYSPKCTEDNHSSLEMNLQLLKIKSPSDAVKEIPTVTVTPPKEADFIGSDFSTTKDISTKVDCKVRQRGQSPENLDSPLFSNTSSYSNSLYESDPNRNRTSDIEKNYGNNEIANICNRECAFAIPTSSTVQTERKRSNSISELGQKDEKSLKNSFDSLFNSENANNHKSFSSSCKFYRESSTLTGSSSEEYLTPQSLSPLPILPPSASPPSASPPSASPPSASPPSASRPSVSPQSLSPLTISPPSASPPSALPPSVWPPSVSPQSLSPLTISPPSVSPQSLSPLTISPPSVSPPTTKSSEVSTEDFERVSPIPSTEDFEIVPAISLTEEFEMVSSDSKH